MIAIVFSALLLWSGQLASGLSNQNDYLSKQYRAQTQQKQMVAVAESLELYFREHNAFPVSLTALASTPGYEYVKSSLNVWQGYAVSPAIVDNAWTFARMVAFTNDPSKGGAAATYLAGNTCGTGGYDTAASWCGTKTSMWYRKETRDPLNELITSQRAHFNRLTQKFANYYNGYGKFPSLDGANVALVANSITALSTLAGYAGAANNCTGQYQYQGVPIDCGDMFDLWGGQIGYQYVGDKHILLVSETPVFNNLGGRVVIAADNTAP